MFEAEEDGAVVEDELAVILKSALGVEDVPVGEFFRAVDTGDKGKIMFGNDLVSTFSVRVKQYVEICGVTSVQMFLSLHLTQLFFFCLGCQVCIPSQPLDRYILPTMF